MPAARMPHAGHPISRALSDSRLHRMHAAGLPTQVVQGTLIFDRNATLYRAIVGSIRTVRDYVEGRRGRGGAAKGGGLHAVQSASSQRSPSTWQLIGWRARLTRGGARPWPPLIAAGPRIIRPIFEHEVRQDGDSVVLLRWVHGAF